MNDHRTDCRSGSKYKTWSNGNIDEVLSKLSNLIELHGFEGIVYVLTMLVRVGCVVSYSAIAKILGTHPRRVARALARNPYPLVVPCHRIVRKDGSLGGYTPMGRDFKEKILRIEGVEVEKGRLRNARYICDDELLALVL